MVPYSVAIYIFFLIILSRILKNRLVMLKGLKSSILFPMVSLSFLYINTSLAVQCSSGIRLVSSQQFISLARLFDKIFLIFSNRQLILLFQEQGESMFLSFILFSAKTFPPWCVYMISNTSSDVIQKCKDLVIGNFEVLLYCCSMNCLISKLICSGNLSVSPVDLLNNGPIFLSSIF